MDIVIKIPKTNIFCVYSIDDIRPYMSYEEAMNYLSSKGFTEQDSKTYLAQLPVEWRDHL